VINELTVGPPIGNDSEPRNSAARQKEIKSPRAGFTGTILAPLCNGEKSVQIPSGALDP